MICLLALPIIFALWLIAQLIPIVLWVAFWTCAAIRYAALWAWQKVR